MQGHVEHRDGMSTRRAWQAAVGELDAVLSSRFQDALRARQIRLLSYRDVIAKQGLNSMTRPTLRP